MIEYINTNILVLLAILIIMMFFKRSKKYFFEKVKKIKYIMFDFFQHILKVIIDYLAKVELILSKNKSIKNDLFLEDLTANIIENKNSNQLETYLSALKFAVGNDNVINIALTGGFGTGKSTIINEFCKKNRGYEYLHISLASFNDDKADEKLIETSIVQQILYYEKKLKIKESSYKRIHFTKPTFKIGFIFLLVIWIYAIVYLFFDKINNNILIFDNLNSDTRIFKIVFISGFFYILYKSFDKIKNLKLSKLTHNSLEIVNEKTDKDLSVFNRNIDEIIYFFEKTNTNIVIVEDIDRFSDDVAIKLYSKIRELSILIKQAKDVIQPVKFIYSVKDELILEDKTKFFDIIIPVIPVTDYSNSKNKFFLKLESFFEKEEVENFKELESKSYLDKNFISEVSNYVYDMRTIINICNEFKLYNEILKIDKPIIDKNKLFAIIFYKNIYPDDFALIQKNESRLHRVFKKDFVNDKSLEKIILELDNKIQKEINEKDVLEKRLNSLILKDINELRNVYIFNLIALIIQKTGDIVKNIEELKLGNDLITDENFQKIKESNNIKFNYDYRGNNNSNVSFKEVEIRVDSEISYNERENHIKKFHENKIDLLERKILLLRNEKQDIINLSLLELYQFYDEEINHFLETVYTSKIIRIVEGKENIEDEINPNINLFKYLLKNDYLNEDFIEYVSYFYPGSLSSSDHKLMMKINQNEVTSFDEKIDNVENLVKNVRDIRFKNKSILNYDIFRFLLKDAQDSGFSSDKLDFVLYQIQNYEDHSVYFLEGFLDSISDDEVLLSNFYVVITKWDKFWNLVETKFSVDLKRKVLFDLIQLFSDDLGNPILIQLNKNKGMTNFINRDKNLLKDIYNRITLDSFIKILMLLEVKFEAINSDEKIKDLLFKIYENNLYQINIDNLKLFSQIDEKYNYNEHDFYQSNYSFLKSNIDTNLYKKISSNLNIYIENVYLKIDQNKNEKASELLYLLECKNEIIDLDNKLQIIKKGFSGKLDSFGKIQEKEIYKLLVEENKILVSWDNILEYYSWEGPSIPNLTNYLNIEENFLNLSIADLYKDLDTLFDKEESCLDFIYSLVNDEKLSEKSFESIFSDSGDIVLRSKEIKIKLRNFYLEEKTFFVFDHEEFESLIDSNKEVLIRLIEKNESDFIAEIDEYNFDIGFLADLLSSKLSTETLSMIIGNREKDIIKSSNLDLLQRITEFYIKHKFSDITIEMLEKLIGSNLEENYKVSMFNMATSDKENPYDVSDLLGIMGGKFASILENEVMTLKLTEENGQFLNTLKENELIRGFKRNNKKEIYNIFYS